MSYKSLKPSGWKVTGKTRAKRDAKNEGNDFDPIYGAPKLHWQDDPEPNLLKEIYSIEQIIDTHNPGEGEARTKKKIPYLDRKHQVYYRHGLKSQQLEKLMNSVLKDIYEQLDDEEVTKKLCVAAADTTGTIDKSRIFVDVLAEIGVPGNIEILCNRWYESRCRVLHIETMKLGFKDAQDMIEEMRPRIEADMLLAKDLLIKWFMTPYKACPNCLEWNDLILPAALFTINQARSSGLDDHCRTCTRKRNLGRYYKGKTTTLMLSEQMGMSSTDPQFLTSSIDLLKQMNMEAKREHMYIQTVLEKQKLGVPLNTKKCSGCGEHKAIILSQDFLTFLEDISNLRKVNLDYFQSATDETLFNYYLHYLTITHTQLAQPTNAAKFSLDSYRADGYNVYCKDCVKDRNAEKRAKALERRQQADQEALKNLPLFTEVLKDEKED